MKNSNHVFVVCLVKVKEVKIKLLVLDRLREYLNGLLGSVSSRLDYFYFSGESVFFGSEQLNSKQYEKLRLLISTPSKIKAVLYSLDSVKNTICHMGFHRVGEAPDKYKPFSIGLTTLHYDYFSQQDCLRGTVVGSQQHDNKDELLIKFFSGYVLPVRCSTELFSKYQKTTHMRPVVELTGQALYSQSRQLAFCIYLEGFQASNIEAINNESLF